MTREQLSALESSLDEKHLAESLKGSVRSFIATTINTARKGNRFDDQEVKDTKNRNWSKMPVLYGDLTAEWMHCVTSSGSTMNLSTIINSKKLRFVTNDGIVGYGFKIGKFPFAKGSSRLAYRGHFDSVEYEFKSTEVVVKKSSTIPAEEFLKIQAVAEVFEEKWNDLVDISDEEGGKRTIEFLSLYMANIKGTDDDVTIEEYINKTRYTKW